MSNNYLFVIDNKVRNYDGTSYVVQSNLQIDSSTGNNFISFYSNSSNSYISSNGTIVLNNNVYVNGQLNVFNPNTSLSLDVLNTNTVNANIVNSNTSNSYYVYSNNLIVANTANINSLYVISNGNIGIGNSSPYGTFQVSGTINGQLPKYDIWIDTTSSSRTDPSVFTKSYKSSIITYGGVNHYYAASVTSLLFQMKVYAVSNISISTYFTRVDDNAYCWLNGSNIANVAVSTPTAVTWNLVQGVNTIQMVLNNSGGGGAEFNFFGEFINNSNTFYTV